MKTRIILLFLIASTLSFGQTATQPTETKVGVELDVLPYLTGGYYGSVWAYNNHFRYRAVITHVTTPEFMVKDGFTNNEIQGYALIADYFFSPKFEKWWIGSGIEYWDAQIQSDQKLSTSDYDVFMLTFGSGYVWNIGKNFYVNPWAALHFRLEGDNKVMVDGNEFNTPAFIPECSLKVGWYFDIKKKR
ncbi:MAG: hypothetical protein R2819_01315 [Allomuricauda sp.]